MFPPMLFLDGGLLEAFFGIEIGGRCKKLKWKSISVPLSNERRSLWIGPEICAKGLTIKTNQVNSGLLKIG